MSKTQMQRPAPPGAATPLSAVRANLPPVGLPEAEFEAVARVAAQAFGAPMAFVALIDAGRPSFKASVGIQRLQLDREFALCAHGGPDAPRVVEDLGNDARLRLSPLVAGAPYLRFYAGAPVLDAAGGALATVGVLDVQPRSASDVQRHVLRDLASVVKMTLQARSEAAELARQAMVDPLTGAASRAQFDQALDVELRHSMRTGEPFTLLRLSVDGVDDIRNGFGTAAADAALRDVSARMAVQVRVGDVLARLEAEEFGIVMRHGAASAAEVLAGRIVDAVRQPLVLASGGANGDAVGVRVCIGIAAYADDVDSAAALMAQAEQALGDARRQNERRWNFFGRKFEAAALRLVTDDDAGLAPEV